MKFRPRVAASLVLSEKALGVTALLYFGRKLIYGREIFTAWGFHLHREESLLISEAALHGLAFLFVATALGFIFVSQLRNWSAFGLAFFSWYTASVDYLGRYTEDRLFLIYFLLISASPPIESKRGFPMVRHPGVYHVMEHFLVTFYFLSGFAKLWYGDWLKDSQTLWSHLQGPYYTDLGEWMMNLPAGQRICTLGQTVAVFEFVVPLCLMLGSKSRTIFVGGLVCMHLAISLLMDGLWLFSIQMIALDLMLLPDKLTWSVIVWMLELRDKIATLVRLRYFGPPR